MTTKDNGGDAFPMSTPADIYPGMTLRDWFAGQALSGMASSLSPVERVDLAQGVIGGKIVAGAAYALADAMIAERSK